MFNTAEIYYPSGTIEKYFIKSIWRLCEYNILERTETILPKGTVEIIFNFSDEIIYCNYSSGIRKRLPSCFINGINFKPFKLIKNGQQIFLGIQLNTIGLKVLFNESVKQFNNNILEGWQICQSLDTLSHQLFYKNSFDEQIQTIMIWINHRICTSNCIKKLIQVHNLFFSQKFIDITVKKLSNKVYLSERQLRRLSSDWLGMSTETFLLYNKYLASLHLLHKDNLTLSEIGLQAGYYDQSHFIREFKYFTDLTPKQYQHSFTKLPGHIFL